MSLSPEQQREVDQEVLECARYGEEDELRQMLEAGGNVNHRDSSGNTALHKAAANNHVGCLSILKEYSALYVPNDSGNLPIHWAAQNKSLDALKFLFENYSSIIDVLAPNKAGLSTLSEAFNSGDADIISACLEHPTSSEEKLLAKMDSKPSITELDDSNTNIKIDSAEKSHTDIENETYGAVNHIFNFAPSCEDCDDSILKRKTVFLRELPISRADNPFGDDTCPENDTTGLGVWPASILLARYVVQMKSILEGKVVLELGCGCGLPGLAAAVYCNPKKMFLTDIHIPTLNNLKFNALKNNFVKDGTDDIEDSSTSIFRMESSAHCDSDTVVTVLNLNWKDSSTFPKETVDVLIGADLVYDVAILQMLTPAIGEILTEGGTFLYCAPDNARDGMDQFVEALAEVNVKCISQQPCPDEMYSNPFDSKDNDLFVLHFYDLSARVPHSLFQFIKSTPRK